MPTGQAAAIACHVSAARQLASRTTAKANLPGQLADFKTALMLIMHVTRHEDLGLDGRFPCFPFRRSIL